MNWRGKPLISHEAIVNLIATTTRKGLKIEAEIDRNVYPKGIHVSEEELEKLQSKELLFMATAMTRYSFQPKVVQLIFDLYD